MKDAAVPTAIVLEVLVDLTRHSIGSGILLLCTQLWLAGVDQSLLPRIRGSTTHVEHMWPAAFKCASHRTQIKTDAYTGKPFALADGLPLSPSATWLLP